jgi:hypothetical protein
MSNYTGIPEEEGNNYDQDLDFTPSTIETVDYAIYDYINDKLSLKVTSKDGQEKVPIVWSSAERSFQIKNNPDYRDNEGTIILPAITIERTSINKDLNRRGRFYGDQFPIQSQKEKGGSLVIARQINQKKTSEFANNDANRRYGGREGPRFVRNPTKKVVYEYITIPAIVYSVINYEITLANNLSSMDNEERRFETKVNIEVLGYFCGGDENSTTPTYSIRENAVQFRIPRERALWDDPLVGNDNHKNKGVDDKYRE